MVTFTNRLGIVGELIAMTEFVKAGFEVFTPISDGNSQIDFIALKDDKLIRVNVKSTTNKRGNAYCAYIKSTSPGSKKTLSRTKSFDSESCDILAVYIQPINSVCFINSKEIGSKSVITLAEMPSKNAVRQRLISDYTSLESALGLVGKATGS